MKLGWTTSASEYLRAPECGGQLVSELKNRSEDGGGGQDARLVNGDRAQAEEVNVRVVLGVALRRDLELLRQPRGE